MSVSVFKTGIVISILCVIVSVGALFSIKAKVQQLNKSLIKVDSRIIEEAEELHILKAEFAHLSRLSRVEKLATQYLSLQVTKPEQTVNSYEHIQVAFNKAN